MNLIRTLVTFNTLIDLINLVLTCKQLGRLLRIARMEREVGYRDWLDLGRIQELSTGRIKVKIYETVKLRIVHINPATHSFYALDTHTILEGVFARYNEVNSSPGIRNVSTVDVAGDTIACANSFQLDVSQPSRNLHILLLELVKSVRIFGERGLLQCSRLRRFKFFNIA